MRRENIVLIDDLVDPGGGFTQPVITVSGEVPLVFTQLLGKGLNLLHGGLAPFSGAEDADGPVQNETLSILFVDTC